LLDVHTVMVQTRFTTLMMEEEFLMIANYVTKKDM
jgi:hypothetical protein